MLEESEWYTLIEKVAGRATFREYDEALKHAASILRGQFASELWDRAKHAGKEDDVVWSALILRLLSLLLGKAVDAAKNSAVTAMQVAELQASIKTLANAIDTAIGRATLETTYTPATVRAEIEYCARRYQEDLNASLNALDLRIEALHKRHDSMIRI